MLRLGRASHRYKGTLCVLCNFSVSVKLFQNKSLESVQSPYSQMLAQNRTQWEPLGSPFLRLITGTLNISSYFTSVVGTRQRNAEHRNQNGLGKLKTTDKTGIFLALRMIFSAA